MPAKVAGVELTAGTPSAAQLGGTDNWPSEDAWPTLAATGAGAAAEPANPAGATAAAGSPEPTLSVKPKAKTRAPGRYKLKFTSRGLARGDYHVNLKAVGPGKKTTKATLTSKRL